jgi:hypothetical protein
VRTPGGKAFKTMSLLVNRLKTAGVNPGEDNITHFVHINDFKKDYIPSVDVRPYEKIM